MCSSADDITRQALALFSDLSQIAQQIFANPIWNLPQSRRLSREARALLASIHERLVEREMKVLSFNQGRARFLQSIGDHPFLSELQDYFRDQLAAMTEVPESLTPALTYFESELSLALNIRTLLVAAVLGAIVGAVLASLLTWGLGHLGRPATFKEPGIHGTRQSESLM
jgi:hypothetical protein